MCSQVANHHNHFVHPCCAVWYKSFLMFFQQLILPCCRETLGDLGPVYLWPFQRTVLLQGLADRLHTRTWLHERPRLDIKHIWWYPTESPVKKSSRPLRLCTVVAFQWNIYRLGMAPLLQVLECHPSPLQASLLAGAVAQRVHGAAFVPFSFNIHEKDLFVP